MNPIDHLVTSAVRCMKCQAKYGECDCWVTMECMTCHRKKQTDRAECWPKGTRKVMIYCPLCPGDTIEFIDRDGNKIEL